MEKDLHAFKMLREVCITISMLAFADCEKPFLLETNVLKEGLFQKQADGNFHPVAYDSWTLTTLEQNYHSSKLEFLAM